MNHWVLDGDVLEITDGKTRISVNADQIYVSVFEGKTVRSVPPGGKSGDAKNLRFSRYPVNLMLVITSLTKLLEESGYDSKLRRPQKFSGLLILKKVVIEGGPVIDRFSVDALRNLIFSVRTNCEPEGINASLFPYQKDGWFWLRFILREQLGGLLADEMGLGEMLQVISALRDPGNVSEGFDGVFVLAPGSLLVYCRIELLRRRAFIFGGGISSFR